ncbi:hypothetical protein EXIGLDRAFT_794470 [Exidia glandulosa HHB12029]|uniref:Cupredoxin n=1 Tax=Exidia glandulosa HHB12029 TaxID=1314781 RepID=A0A165NHJ5_EXIGL|nr:hypothetical protein EXIGLDRAFT_794470 [Exidia glandulosa HHB12029]
MSCINTAIGNLSSIQSVAPMSSLQFMLAAVATWAISPLMVQCMIINIGFPPLNATLNGPVTPIAINASRGDILIWTFDDAAKKANHSVVQVSFDDPCSPLADGFASPIGALNEADFAIMITDDSAPASADHLHNHCQEGEVGFVSPQAQIGPNESDQTIRTLGIKLPTAPYSPALANISASGLGSGVGAQVVDAQAAETSTTGSIHTSTASGAIATSTPTQSQPSSTFMIRSAPLVLIAVCTGLILVSLL